LGICINQKFGALHMGVGIGQYVWPSVTCKLILDAPHVGSTVGHHTQGCVLWASEGVSEMQGTQQKLFCF